MRIIICAGGTGGHIYPGIAVASCIKSKDPAADILFLSSEKKIDKDIIESEGFKVKQIKGRGLDRRMSFSSVFSITAMLAGFVQAFAVVLKFKPDVLLSTGGFSSFPAVISAKLSGIPVIIHEQNVLPGVTNRICSRFADKIAVSFKESGKYFGRDTVHTGNPVRKNIINAVKDESVEKLKIDTDKMNVLVIGGSQGSFSMNNALIDALQYLDRDYISVYHVCGSYDYDRVRALAGSRGIKGGGYSLFPYIHDISDILAVSDLVISRAGATAIAEITCRGLPSVLIPYPYASENHQELNARILSDKGAAVVLPDSQLSGDTLSDIIKDLASDKNRLALMAKNSKLLGIPDAAERVVKVIYEAV